MDVNIGFVVLAVRKLVKNDRGWRRMEENRKAKGESSYGELEEELEKKMYGIED